MTSLPPLDPSDALRCLDYFGERLNADERASFEQWMNGDPQREEQIASLREVWEASAHPGVPVNTQAAWGRVRQQVATVTLEKGHVAQRQAPRPWHQLSAARAGLGIVAALTAFIAFWRGGHAPATSQAHTYTTRVGQRAIVRLADGSRVTLAPQTTLVVAADFGATTRRVTLAGEAYFDVPVASHAPFIVRTGTVTTQVLGTSFDIAHDAAQAGVRVAVVQGRVQARVAGRPPVTLGAGMVGRVQDSVIRVTTDNTTAYTAWTNGHLAFRGAPVPEVLAALTRWYGIQFQLAEPSLDRELVTGRFDFGNTADVIAALQATLGVRTTVSSRGDTTIVTLHRQHGNASPAVPPARRGVQDHFPSASEMGR